MNEAPFQALDSELASAGLNNDKLYVTEEICAYWRKSGHWASILSTLGFSGLGLVVLLLFFSGALTSASSVPGPFILLAVVAGFIVFFIVKNLAFYASRIRRAADSCEWDAMEKAFANLCNAYTIYGMITLLATIILLGGIGYLCLFVLPTLSSTH